MLSSNSLPSTRPMRTMLFSFSGKFNSQLTATPPRQVSCERGVSLNPLYLIHLSVPQERGVPYAPAACQCPVTGAPLTSPLCQRVASPAIQGHMPTASLLSAGALSISPSMLPGPANALEGLALSSSSWNKAFVNKPAGDREL